MFVLFQKKVCPFLCLLVGGGGCSRSSFLLRVLCRLFCCWCVFIVWFAGARHPQPRGAGPSYSWVVVDRHDLGDRPDHAASHAYPLGRGDGGGWFFGANMGCNMG